MTVDFGALNDCMIASFNRLTPSARSLTWRLISLAIFISQTTVANRTALSSFLDFREKTKHFRLQKHLEISQNEAKNPRILQKNNLHSLCTNLRYNMYSHKAITSSKGDMLTGSKLQNHWRLKNKQPHWIKMFSQNNCSPNVKRSRRKRQPYYVYTFLCKWITVYRVAQIKIPHRTKWKFSTTVWDFYTHFLIYMGEILLQFWNLKKYFSFLQTYGYVNILCHIFNSARNNQQKLVIFIHVMVSALVCFGGKGRLHLIPDKTKVNAKFLLKPCCRNLFKIADLFCHLQLHLLTGRRACTHGKAGSRLDCYQLQWTHC